MIASIKDLEKLLKLLRKQGVSDFKHGDLELKLGDLPEESREIQQDEMQSDDPYAALPDVILTPDQLSFLSSGGRPEDMPGYKEFDA
jgi:hypothetical protein